jgi:hypothetical protein
MLRYTKSAVVGMTGDTWRWARWWDRGPAGGGGEDVVHGGISNDTNGFLARDDLELDTSGEAIGRGTRLCRQGHL